MAILLWEVFFCTQALPQQLIEIIQLLSQLIAEAMPEYKKKLPTKELPNLMVKLISYIDSSAKTMIPDLGIMMQTDTSYAEEILGFKFKPAKGCISENAKSVVRLGLV